MKGGVTMKLTHKFKPSFSHKEEEIIKELSFHTTKFYNIVNYAIRENNDIRPIYSSLDKQFKSNWHCNYLMAHNRQHCLKQLAKDWKSYFNSIKDYNNNPSKYKSQPQPPSFKNIKFELPKVIQSLIYSKNASLSKGHTVKNTLQQVKIKQDYLTNEWYLLIIYNKDTTDKKQSDNIMSIDLGLDNLASITFKNNLASYIINGKTLKSKNRYYNKRISKLQAIRMKQTGSKHFKDTKQIKKLRVKRRNYITDYLHKASKKVINLAKKHKASKIVIGDLKEIKQHNKNNKHFVAIPIQKFKKLIEYKAKLEGIETIIINEAYTSGCSAIDKEQLTKDNYDKSRRITRGLFLANNSLKINSDINGSLNILRKYLKNSSPKLIDYARDIGVVASPERLRIA